MSRPVRLGSTCFIRIDIVFASGADAFFAFRYEKRAANGGVDGVDISDWSGFMAFGRKGESVLECDECLTLDGNGNVSVHMPASVTSQLEPGLYDYNIALKDTNGVVVNFVEGEAEVSRMIADVD